MGIGLGSRSKCGCPITPPAARVPGNPDPEVFTIKRSCALGRYVMLEVNYPGCTNFEGNKILVFEGVSLAVLEGANLLDPHFCNSLDHPAPIARFKPTEEGWHQGKVLINALTYGFGGQNIPKYNWQSTRGAVP